MKNVIFIFILFTINSFSQDNISQLLIKFNQSNNLIKKAEIAYKLSRKYNWIDLDSSIYFGNFVLKTGKLLNNDSLIAKGNNLLGIAYYYSGYKDSCFYYIKKSISQFKKTNLKLQLANAINNLGLFYDSYNSSDSALHYYLKSINIYSDLNDSVAIADVWNNIAIAYMYAGIYDSSLYYFNKAEIYQKNNGNYEFYADVLSNKSSLFHALADYEKGIKNILKAIRIYDSLEVSHKANTAHFIAGTLYERQKLYELAQNEYKKVLNNIVKFDLKSELGKTYLNIGNTFEGLGNIDSALYYYNLAKINYEAINNEYSISFVYHNLGVLYDNLNEFKKAIDYFKKAYEIRLNFGNESDIAKTATSYASALIHIGNFKEAKKLIDYSYKITSENGDRSALLDNVIKLADFYDITKNYPLSVKYYKRALNLQDSIKSDEQIRIMENYRTSFELNKRELENKQLKEQKEKVELENKLKSVKLKSENQKNKILIFILFLSVVFISTIIYFLFNLKKKNKAIQIEKENVVKQKYIIEEKNKEITDSIQYAKRIQNAILPSEHQWNKHLPVSFIYYLPKDIVAGDFYWLETVGEALETTVYFAAADCTGHGVPGAMVSVVCSNALSKAVVEEKITEPGKILDRTRELVIERFAKSSEDVKDGMDISLCAINFKTMTLQWAGANNPLWIVRNVELEILNDESKNKYSTFKTQNLKLIEIKPDKQPIGKYFKQSPFTTHTIELQKGDVIYVFTDGYQDQFGGEKNKKLMVVNFKKLLLSIQDKSMEEQKIALENYFYEWKGTYEQIDDVCVIGVKV